MKLLHYILHPSYITVKLAEYGIIRMDDYKYLTIKYKKEMNKEINFNRPKTFNEKINYLKLNCDAKKWSEYVDKYSVRNHIKDVLGEQYLIPLIGVYDSFEEIDFSSLPHKFVMKCTHDSGSVYVCKNKDEIPYSKLKKTFRKALKTNYSLRTKEKPYQYVTPRIIVEEYIEDDIQHELRDYKFFCFNGTVDCVMLCYDRNSGDTKFYFFDEKWNLLKYNVRGKKATSDFYVEKPLKIEEMFKIAKKLSEDFPFVRIDLYLCNNQIYFGEYTFFPQSGWDPNLLPETDEYFGNLIKIEGID
ncbi:MAG: glycosyl transferase [Bacilli bacterium]|nr:glycosyl transferase [Bacilli bacterium]